MRYWLNLTDPAKPCFVWRGLGVTQWCELPEAPLEDGQSLLWVPWLMQGGGFGGKLGFGRQGDCNTYIYIHTYIHTLRYITLHYITFTLHYITFTLHYITFTFTLHYITLPLHYITLHHITLHYITLHTHIHIIYIYTHMYIYILYTHYTIHVYLIFHHFPPQNRAEPHFYDTSHVSGWVATSDSRLRDGGGS